MLVEFEVLFLEKLDIVDVVVIGVVLEERECLRVFVVWVFESNVIVEDIEVWVV